MDIRKKKHFFIIFCLLLISLIIIVAITISMQRMLVIESELIDDVNEQMQHATLSNNMIFHAKEKALILYQIATTQDILKQDDLFIKFIEHGNRFIETRNKLLTMELTNKEKILINNQGDLTNQTTPLEYNIIELARSGNYDKSIQLLSEEATPAQNRISEILHELNSIQNIHTRHELDSSSITYKKTAVTSSWVIFLIVIISTSIAIYILRKFLTIHDYLIKRDNELSVTNKILQQNIDELNQTTERLDLIFRGTNDGIWDWNLPENEIYFSPRWKEMLGYTNDEINNNFLSMQKLIHPDDLGCTLTTWTNCMEGKNNSFNIEYRLMNKQGEYIWVMSRGLVLLNNNEPVRIAASTTDITSRKKSDLELLNYKSNLEKMIKDRTQELERLTENFKQLSQTDSLTGIANRRYMDIILEQEYLNAKRTSTPLSFMLIDVDHFKKINDEYGHQQGDICLQQIAKLLTNSLKRPHDFVARYGGEEFAIILADTNIEGALNVCASIHNNIEKLETLPKLPDTGQPLTVSIGLFSQQLNINCTPDSIIKAADTALYRAKTNGRNQTVVHQNTKTKLAIS
ncbi:MAG: sensor domain-containing diguanylate cyclase [Gammaproteobacteria bacterium]|nr:sensor domain-containing diguanylate cyclase [Gammaproteobacteria bacterium]